MHKDLGAVGTCPVLKMVKSQVEFLFLPQEWDGWMEGVQHPVEVGLDSPRFGLSSRKNLREVMKPKDRDVEDAFDVFRQFTITEDTKIPSTGQVPAIADLLHQRHIVNK